LEYKGPYEGELRLAHPIFEKNFSMIAYHELNERPELK
jgi:hypothetical protein